MHIDVRLWNDIRTFWPDTMRTWTVWDIFGPPPLPVPRPHPGAPNWRTTKVSANILGISCLTHYRGCLWRLENMTSNWLPKSCSQKNCLSISLTHANCNVAESTIKDRTHCDHSNDSSVWSIYAHGVSQTTASHIANLSNIACRTHIHESTTIEMTQIRKCTARQKRQRISTSKLSIRPVCSTIGHIIASGIVMRHHAKLE